MKIVTPGARRIRIVLAVSILAMAIPSCFLTTFRQYTEYSPNLLAFRRVHQTTVPFTGFPVSPPETGDWERTPAMQWIVDSGYLTKPVHVIAVATRRSNPEIRRADCHYIIESLRRDEWIAWSQKNPELAARFWPLFVNLSNAGLRWEGLEASAELLYHAEQHRHDEVAFQTLLAKYGATVDVLHMQERALKYVK